MIDDHGQQPGANAREQCPVRFYRYLVGQGFEPDRALSLLKKRR